ncbi:DHA2 family multidrug resistance protein-like MFS transporter [Murinocardiopsis flavida]|uniref:DHA2 family multidrug resistance protein-like MFS transporter n=1 Tax=Murinocardiopsis flavida TaxID=645275 RepID=A0A2P8CQY9_9ACTN|nr:MFS transporter [Murinocardiopsis flavida]PSK87366.1 DHA2 family multidrug resistance protein-like MFS transporter [Murinocardiopsis flavida]
MRTGTTGRAGWREWSGLALLALPTMLLGLDVTALYLVVPNVAADLDPTAAETLWIMDAYGFFIAGFLITMGTLGDRIGRRRLLMVGAAAFGVVSVFAAFAPSAFLLIVARALLGVAGATLMPSTLSLISTLFTDARQRALAIGVWAMMFAMGMAAGPVVGGALVAGFWWGAVFLIAVPVAVLVLAGAPVLLPEYRDLSVGRIDLPSIGLSLVAMLPLVYAVKQVAGHGADVPALVATIVGGGAAVAFVRRQLRLAEPLLDMNLFAGRAFSAALGVLLIGLVGFGGVMYLVTQYLQLVEGLTPMAAGLWMGPPAGAMLIGSLGAPLLARRVSPGVVMAATLAVSLLGYALLALAGTGGAGGVDGLDSLDGKVSVVAGFAFVYLGLGVIAALGTDIVVAAAPPEKAGSAAALSETVQELGIAAGVAVLGSLTTAVYRAALYVPPGLSPAAAEAYGDTLGGAVSVMDRLPDGAIDHARAAFTTGLNISAVVAGLGVAAAALACVTVLRHIRPLGEPAPEAVPVASAHGTGNAG